MRAITEAFLADLKEQFKPNRVHVSDCDIKLIFHNGSRSDSVWIIFTSSATVRMQYLLWESVVDLCEPDSLNTIREFVDFAKSDVMSSSVPSVQRLLGDSSW